MLCHSSLGKETEQLDYFVIGNEQTFYSMIWRRGQVLEISPSLSVSTN